MIKVDANRPKKMPLVTEQELKFYDSEMLNNILLLRGRLKSQETTTGSVIE